MTYRIFRFFFRLYFRIYFGKIQVFGADKIPSNAGVLLSPNHQNALIDPLVIAVCLQQPIYFFTRGDVFVPLVKGLFKRLQLLPVYRIRNGFSSLKKNRDTFARGTQLLSEGEKVVMFSEGLHHLEYYLYPISKGSSRFVLEAQQKTSRPIYMLPVGINYSHPHRAGAAIHLVFGDPIAVPKESTKPPTSPQRIRSLKEDLEKKMRQCLWIPEKSEDYPLQLRQLTYALTRKSFDEVRSLLQHPSKELPKKGRIFPIEKFFGWMNFPPTLWLNRQCHQLKDPVFEGTTRLAGSLVVFPIWWFSTGLLAHYYYGFKTAIITAAALILAKHIENKINIRKINN